MLTHFSSLLQYPCAHQYIRLRGASEMVLSEERLRGDLYSHVVRFRTDSIWRRVWPSLEEIREHIPPASLTVAGPMLSEAVRCATHNSRPSVRPPEDQCGSDQPIILNSSDQCVLTHLQCGISLIICYPMLPYVLSCPQHKSPEPRSFSYHFPRLSLSLHDPLRIPWTSRPLLSCA
jgi:hypothetical protein